jgi:GTP 3',8-cyclase
MKPLIENIQDDLGRSFKKLRISLTSECNFSCTYCVGENELKLEKKNNFLSYKEFVVLLKALLEKISISEIRLTGGEPTLYPELIELVKEIKSLGIEKVSMTTNGYLLEKLAKPLKLAGLDSINLSLDTISPELFQIMSRGKKLSRTLAGLEAAISEEFSLKINSTIVKGQNDSEVLSLLDFSGEKKIPIRYLELMNMGHFFESKNSYLFTEQKILQSIGLKYSFTPLNRAKSSTAKYWMTENNYQFGIISNSSDPFCNDCDRLRMDSKGNLRGCISSKQSFPLKKLIDEKTDLTLTLHEALATKKRDKFTGNTISMKTMGG